MKFFLYISTLTAITTALLQGCGNTGANKEPVGGQQSLSSRIASQEAGDEMTLFQKTANAKDAKESLFDFVFELSQRETTNIGNPKYGVFCGSEWHWKGIEDEGYWAGTTVTANEYVHEWFWTNGITNKTVHTESIQVRDESVLIMMGSDFDERNRRIILADLSNGIIPYIVSSYYVNALGYVSNGIVFNVSDLSKSKYKDLREIAETNAVEKFFVAGWNTL